MHSRRAHRFLTLLLALAGAGRRRARRAPMRSTACSRCSSAYVDRRERRVPAVRARRLSGQRRHPRRAQGRAHAHLRPRRRGVARAALLDGRRRGRVHAQARAAATTRSATATSRATWTRATAASSTATPRSKKRSRRWAPWTPGRSCSSPQLTANREYRVSLRAGVRRGRLPDTLRVLLFWTDDWHRESEWFSWSLPR